MITVTGATGNLGGLIIEELLKNVEAGEITAVVRTPEKAAHLAEKGITVRQGDYSDPASLVSAFAGADVLMFISNSDFGSRMEQHQNVINAAKETGVSRVVYTSFANIDGQDPLAASHRATETAVRDAGLTYTFLRPNFYMDIYAGDVEIAIMQGSYRSPKGDAGAAYITRADIARAAAAVLTASNHENKVYTLTGPTTVTPAVIAEVASKISGQNIKVEPISWEELAEDYKKRGLPDDFIPMAVNMERLIATNVLAPVSEDITLLTGIVPMDIESFVRQEKA